MVIRTGCGFPQELEELLHQVLGRPAGGHVPEQLVVRSAKKALKALGVEDPPDPGMAEVFTQARERQRMLKDLTRELVHGHPREPGA